MKIYTKIVIDIKTGKIIEEESYNYEGIVALADPGTIAIASIVMAGVSAATGIVGTVSAMQGQQYAGAMAKRESEQRA